MQDESGTSGQLPQPPLGEFEPGSIAFYDYLIIGKVGAGGMGVVYKATNILLDRNAALKVLPVDAISVNDVVRFQNEARTLSRLEHSNIARLFDFGIGDGHRPYLSMEFVEGDTLQESIEKNGPLPLDLFFEVFIQICHGLAHAHEKNIVHRDVKTSNIMLSVDDSGALRAVLLDFGVAKMSDDSGQVTKTGGMVGSPLYISPEQIVGEPATAASDIYSLSCVMFCALTGEPPFSGETVLETLTLHREGVVPIKKLDAIDGIFPDLCKLIEQGLSKSPAQRPQSIKEISTQLASLACQLPDTEFGADDDSSEAGKTSSSATLTGIDSRQISDRAAQMLYETATRELPVDANDRKSRKAVFVAAGVCLVGVVAFIGAILFNALAALKPKDEPAIKIERVQPAIDDPELRLRLNNADVLKFEQKTADNLDRYIKGSRAKNPVVMTILHEADNARKRPSPKTEELYTAEEEYNRVLELRQESGPVQPPDVIMARAYIGIYDCELQLRQYNKLADLEKQILKYCPKGAVANEAFSCVQKAADANVKRSKPEEAVRCLECSVALLKRNDFRDAEQLAGIELNIGTAYLGLADYVKARLWLDRASLRLQKRGKLNVIYFASLIRSGVASRLSKDYKGAIQKFRAAEKVVANLTEQERPVYFGHMCYQWAVTLVEMKKYDEALNRIQKGLAEADERTAKILRKLRETVKTKQLSNPQMVTH